MVIEIGVDSARLENWMFGALKVIRKVVFACGKEDVIITPAYERVDGSISDDYDVLLVEMGCWEDKKFMYRKLKRMLSGKHDVTIVQSLIQVKYIYG